MLKSLFVCALLVVFFSEQGEAKKHRRNRQIQNGPTSYALFEMVKFQGKEPYSRSIRYPIFKGTSEFKTELINDFFKEQIANAWLCKAGTEQSQLNINSKMLLFNPKFSSIRISFEDSCSKGEKKKYEKAINFSLASGKIFTQSDFVDEAQISEFDKVYLEKVTEGASEECLKMLAEKNNNSNYEFFVFKDQILVSKNPGDASLDCDYDAEFSGSELKKFKENGVGFNL